METEGVWNCAISWHQMTLILMRHGIKARTHTCREIAQYPLRQPLRDQESLGHKTGWNLTWTQVLWKKTIWSTPVVLPYLIMQYKDRYGKDGQGRQIPPGSSCRLKSESYESNTFLINIRQHTYAHTLSIIIHSHTQWTSQKYTFLSLVTRRAQKW